MSKHGLLRVRDCRAILSTFRTQIFVSGEENGQNIKLPSATVATFVHKGLPGAYCFCLFKLLTQDLHDPFAVFRSFEFGFRGLNRAMYFFMRMSWKLPMDVLDFVRLVRNQASVTILIVLSHASSWHRTALVGSQALSHKTTRAFESRASSACLAFRRVFHILCALIARSAAPCYV
jgi:hypothetical protein